MANPIIMPKQGQSVESCIIAKWHKKKGDAVAVGDMLFTYETDKATFDEEAKEAGVMLDVFFEEGDDVPCLTNVCVIGNAGEDASAFAPNGGSDEAPAEETAKAEAPKAEVAAAVTVNKSGDAKVSPRAKNLAERAKVDALSAVPTGPNGRIIERDIESLIANGGGATPAAASTAAGEDGTGIGGRVRVEDLGKAASSAAPGASAAAAPEFVEEPISNIRKVIARSMHDSLSNMAQLTLNTSFDATEIMAYRASLKKNAEKLGLANITLNDIVLFAASRVLPNHKGLNAHFTGDKMKFFTHVNLGVAVDTARGLMVPTIFGAENKTLNEIAVESKALASQCQSGTISPDFLTGGSFTVTNLGSMGIESFTPVINPPQTGILGVDTISTGVKEENGQIKLYKKMGLSLTFDHRAVDGAPAAKFLKELCDALENFNVFLAK